MIAYLKGRLMSVDEESAILDCQGVGYELLCAGPALADLSSRLGGEVAIWVYTHVREDALQLFGFVEKADKDLFLSLTKVNGVGPKMALSILSGASTSQIHDMIEAGDAKALSKLPRVGKKTAEQIVLTLQGKLVRVNGPSKAALPDAHRQVHSALVNLGFKLQKVEEFVADLPKNVDVEEGVRQGLAQLSSAR